jgi:peptidoglycan/LPS O-acetylase OafA/YrhL
MFKNNFDFLRLIFAIFVMITHAYPLAGHEENDLLSKLTNGHFSFSYIGVKGFFIISGYLIYQSLLRSKSLIDFYWKRFLRLFPALIIMLFLTILLAPLIYEGSINYFNNRKVYTYFIRNCLLYNVQYSIPGIFENNLYKNAINGSLWTICYEFTMYILLSGLFFIKSKTLLLKNIIVFLIIISFTLFTFRLQEFNFYGLNSNYLLELGYFFLTGSLLAALDFHKFKYLKMLLIFALLILILNEIFNFNLSFLKLLLLPFLIIGFGLQSFKYINSIASKIGDLSYGIYIYGFPVQQTFMYFFKLEPLSLMLFSIPTSMVLAFLSWHLIEKKALVLKKLNLDNYLNLKFANKINQDKI